MQASDFAASAPGRLIPTIHGDLAFVPTPLPPAPLDLGPLAPLLTRSARALGELSGIGRTLPNPYLLIRPFMRKEAVASSRIEGTISNLSDLLLFELDEQPKSGTPADAREVLNYVRALERCIARLDELPVSTRLIREAHGILLTGVHGARGGNIVPGQFKTSQNWIGVRVLRNARFVPPPPAQAVEAMSDLEKFINRDCEDTMPFLVKLALVHYQFETIHPFPDGNGRVGRLLIPLMLHEKQEIAQPLLYLSSYFESHYTDYIDKMLRVSQRADWMGWIVFFLTAIQETCNDAVCKVQALQDLQRDYRATIQTARASALLTRVVDEIFEHPAVTIPSLSASLGITYNAAKKHIERLVDMNILVPFGGRPKVWFATQLVETIGS